MRRFQGSGGISFDVQRSAFDVLRSGFSVLYLHEMVLRQCDSRLMAQGSESISWSPES